jgi:CrcB protein
MNTIFSVALGGALGSLMRHWAIAFWVGWMGNDFPYGTLFVNIVGSFVMGFLMEIMALRWQVSQEVRALIFSGVLGGFTTFSAFSLDVFRLAETGHYTGTALYVVASVGLSLLAIFGGAYLVRHLVA